MDAFVDFTNNVGHDVYTSSLLIWGFSAATDTFSIRCLLDNVANEAHPPALDGYLSIGNQTSNSLRSETMSNMTSELVRDHRT